MRTTIDHVILKEIDDTNKVHENWVKIRTKDGELMANRVIQLFSQYPNDRIEYDPTLELEIYKDYFIQLEASMSASMALQSDSVDEELYDAIFGPKPSEPYATFAESQISSVLDKLMDEARSNRSVKLQDESIKVPDETDDVIGLFEQMLRARRRLRKFNLRHSDEVTEFLALPTAEGIKELARRIEARSK